MFFDQKIRKKIAIYTDGACSGNPGPGGWGAILIWNHREKELSGSEALTTNNRMELLAALEALRSLKEPCDVDLYTDSAYLRNGMTNWIFNWKGDNWKVAERNSIKNLDLWKALEQKQCEHKIIWHWLKGHAGHPLNERADALARQAIKTLHLTKKNSY